MPVPPLFHVYQDWHCPNCQKTDRTPALPPNATRFHTCPALHMLTAPLVRAGTDCEVVAVERGDYLRKAEQRRGSNGKPYMSVVTRYADGSNDTAVFAEPATLFGGR